MTAAADDLPNLDLTPSKNTDKSVTKLQGSTRQTPRSRKRAKATSSVFRSKSCDRGGVGAALMDLNLSCMARSGRTSPADSMDWQREQDLPMLRNKKVTSYVLHIIAMVYAASKAKCTELQKSVHTNRYWSE